jgi:hypothetical protein
LEVSGPLSSELVQVERAIAILDKYVASGPPWDQLDEVLDEIKNAREAIYRANKIMRGKTVGDLGESG